MDLKEYLKQNDCSIARFSRMMGITRQHMSLIANKKAIPSKQIALHIELLTHFNVTMEDLGVPNE